MSAMQDDVLGSLTPSSTLLVVLRTLYRLRLEYGVYLPEDSTDTVVFSKDQLVALIERVNAETLVKDLTSLAERGIFRPLAVSEDFTNEEDAPIQALVVEKRGAWLEPLMEALLPHEPDFPEWWEAPLPFALCERGRIYINQMALLMFGPELERIPVPSLAESDEFLVELEVGERPRFLTFRRLEPDIFILEDCSSDDLAEAQDISWWAAIGKAWTVLLESENYSWHRAEELEEDFSGKAYPCEWDGRFCGYFCVEAPASSNEEPKPAVQDVKPEQQQKNEKPKPSRRRRASRAKPKKEDEALKALGPQTMALLAAGQVFEEADSNVSKGKKDGGVIDV